MAKLEFRDAIKEARTLATGASEVLALAHLYVVLLERLRGVSDAHVTAAARIRAEILPQLNRAARGLTSNTDVSTFAWQDAERSYEQFCNTAHGDQSTGRDASMLQWLLTVDFTDPTQKWCREACRRAGVAGTPTRSSAPTVPELGFGLPLPRAELAALGPLFGRDAELSKHLGFMTFALEKATHYLLVGKPGVGKSYFLKHLLGRGLASGRGEFTGRGFVLFGRMDFLGSESENKERFGRLYTYLQQTPDVVPIFDELEHVLRHAPNLAEHFSAMFGSWLAGGGRTFILICDSSVASTTPLLRGIRPCPLPALTHAATRQLLLEDRLPKLCEEHGLALLPSPEALVDSLLNTAPQRYPGRFLPELALHVAESTINRARNRIEFLGQEPLAGAVVEDLWAHIVDEQGLNPEIFGKDPKEFYAKLRTRLTNKVIGQDHAVEQICSVLEMQAQRPPQRAPRSGHRSRSRCRRGTR